MKAVLKGRPEEILVEDMKDGDIGVIISWTYESAVGTIVQRYNTSLVALCHPTGTCWTSFFAPGNPKQPSCKVRLLKPGEYLEIVED